nr:SDR family oxidoreductase [Gammaproteobacteria bacterium]
FIYFSTAHVYGSNIKGTINEDTPTNPNNAYSQTHLEAEKHVLYFHKNKSLNSIILRLSNSIGRPISIDANCWMLAVNHFCREAVLRKEIIINGNPYDQKNFIPISNVERLVTELLSNNLDDYFGQTINIGHSKSLTIIDMAQMISERCKFLLGYTPKIIIKNKNIDQKINEFNYDCRKYISMNIKSNTSLINEIDGILLFCEKQSF